jgi:hypothetical protein
MNSIPFFYYDVLARMIPGALLLAFLHVVGLRGWGWPFLRLTFYLGFAHGKILSE